MSTQLTQPIFHAGDQVRSVHDLVVGDVLMKVTELGGTVMVVTKISDNRLHYLYLIDGVITEGSGFFADLGIAPFLGLRTWNRTNFMLYRSKRKCLTEEQIMMLQSGNPELTTKVFSEEKFAASLAAALTQRKARTVTEIATSHAEY